MFNENDRGKVLLQQLLVDVHRVLHEGAACHRVRLQSLEKLTKEIEKEFKLQPLV